MTNNYFKFRGHLIEVYEFFDDGTPVQVAAAFDRITRQSARYEGSLSVFRIPPFMGVWNDVSEVGGARRWT